jgi:short-subunit dehydrogenase
MLHVLAGRTALVTGASRGLGVFIARRLAKERMHLVLSARDGRKLAALREELAREGLDVRIVAADVRSASERARLGAPSMGADSEVQVLSKAGRSDRSEPQSVEPRGRREGSGERNRGSMYKKRL